MDSKSKLKKTLGQMMNLGSILFLVSLVLENELNGTKYTLVLWGIIIMVFGFSYAKRTRLWIIAIVGLLWASAAWHYFLVRGMDAGYTIGPWIIHFMVVAAFSLIFIRNEIGDHSRLEVNAYRLFQMAVKNIWDTSNGFTNRPYPAGKLTFTKEELNRFAGYLANHHMAKPVIEDKQVYLTFSMNVSTTLKIPVDQLSYVAFNDSGEISVNISNPDYKQLKEEYSFDQLCSAMGHVFRNFIQKFREGKEYLIKEELMSIKIPWI